MKKFRKPLSILCVVCMILSISASVFAAEVESENAVKPLQVYVVDPDGSINLVETVSAEERMSMPQSRMAHHSFGKMDYDNSNDWVYQSSVKVPEQDSGAKTLATGQSISPGDDCIGVYVHSSVLSTINLKVMWAGGDNTYFFSRGFNTNYDLEIYFLDGETHDGGSGLYMDSGTTYSFIVSTRDAKSNYADIEVCPGVYTG